MAYPFVFFDGHVHLASTVGGAEHTLCGVANDAAVSESEPCLKWKETKKSVVNCGTCADIIIECRGVLVNKEKT